MILAKATARPLSPELVRRRKAEAEQELQEHYWPHLVALDDRAAMAELQYWLRRAKAAKLAPVPGTPQDEVLTEALALRYNLERGGRLRAWERQGVETLCVQLRGRVVPIFPAREVRRRPAKITPTLLLLRQQGLDRIADWTLAQRLACWVGSVDLLPYELEFIRANWKNAWKLGPQQFFFQLKVRRAAQALLLGFAYRPQSLRLDQVALFKKGLGFFRKVPLWESAPAQLCLLTAELSKFEAHTSEIVTPPPEMEERVSDLPLIEIMERPWSGVAEQSTLFGDRVPPPAPTWDGDALPQDLF